MTIPQGQNLRWSINFVADTLTAGRRFRILTMVDDFTRECLGLVVSRTSEWRAGSSKNGGSTTTPTAAHEPQRAHTN